jgi:hypothetical protein
MDAMDIVQVKTTKRVRFMSGPPGRAPSPHGNWSIVGFVEADAIIAKDSTIIRIPVEDLQPVASMSTEKLMDALKEIDPKGQTYNTIEHVAQVFDIDVGRAKQLLQQYNLPNKVGSTAELEQVTARIKREYHGKKDQGRRGASRP